GGGADCPAPVARAAPLALGASRRAAPQGRGDDGGPVPRAGAGARAPGALRGSPRLPPRPPARGTVGGPADLTTPKCWSGSPWPCASTWAAASAAGAAAGLGGARPWAAGAGPGAA